MRRSRTRNLPRNVSVIVTLAAMAAAAATVVSIARRRQRRQTSCCVDNLRQISAAAISHCFENNLPLDTELTPDAACFHTKGGTPRCPSGNASYPPFDVLHGPRCANPDHSRVFIAAAGRGERAAVWAAALSYAAASGLSWSNTIDPQLVDVCRYCGKFTGVCPLEGRTYPPFVLSRGPRCPYAETHNSSNSRPPRSQDMFDDDGMVRTNFPLSQVDTADWSTWVGKGSWQRSL